MAQYKSFSTKGSNGKPEAVFILSYEELKTHSNRLQSNQSRDVEVIRHDNDCEIIFTIKSEELGDYMLSLFMNRAARRT